ncbi:tripartite-type tricarboxylate transporter receptor subunit TctC [Cupriavidus gilardii J11]|uniref:Tripartite-type tricarboxylate transporter receptor subunit TctC n=1 Tax=Cupriavidus gilardii J11 TaxID=936133 RepID=A0A562BK25_9BURK|nr:tripartite tricarboxylate transporter substrate binding protein [Cupriavidus gilardii]TWG85595.1 tripartite-type tricarboxylate transporter receptor subunit TctC [Cupriavidus gilardii J11]
MKSLYAALCAIVMSTVAGPALAQEGRAKPWPTQPIRLVVPFPAGGLADGLARMLAPEFEKALGVPFVIDNKPGGSAAIASINVLQSPPDGYSVMLSGFAPLITNRFTQKKLSYDPDAFTRIGLLSATPNVLLASPSAPFKTLPEMIRYAKANPGKVTYGSYGVGSLAHLSGEMLKATANIDMLHVPYKGTSQAVPALLGGDLMTHFDAAGPTLSLIRQGKLRALAVTSARRLPALPDVPTVAEQGYPGFESISWNGIVGPPNMPPAIVAKFNAAINQVMSSPAVRKRLADSGTEALTGSVADFDARLKHEIPRVQALVRRAGIEAE